MGLRIPSIAGGGAAWWRMATRFGLGKCGGVVDIVREDRAVMLRRSVGFGVVSMGAVVVCIRCI